MNARLLVLLALLAGLGTPARAQIKVELQVPHRLYLAYEPMLAAVTITNLSGRDITLEDTPNNQWFGFQISTVDDTPVAPRDLHYKNEPLQIEAGQSIKRTVNLVTLFPITEYGLYRIRGAIYFSPTQRYYTSQPQNIEVTEGKTIWQQTVGVPEGMPGAGDYHVFTVMTHRLAAETRLYVRVEDKDREIVYATFPVGKLTLGQPPEIKLDETNQLHLLHQSGSRTYLHSIVGVNGELLSQSTYNVTKTRPRLHRNQAGKTGVIGGQLEIPAALPPGTPGAPQQPKITDRPPGLPKL